MSWKRRKLCMVKTMQARKSGPSVTEKPRGKYILKLTKLKEQASTDFHYTLVKQIELEIAAIKKVGDNTIRGDEDYLSVPLEVPKSPLN